MNLPQRRFAVTQWDVFSSKPLEGNSLAVLSDARGLSDEEMQAIAREMNLSETTFIFPGDPREDLHRTGRIAVRRASHAGNRVCLAKQKQDKRGYARTECGEGSGSLRRWRRRTNVW